MTNDNSFSFSFDDSFHVDDVDCHVSKLKDFLEKLDPNGDSKGIDHILHDCFSSCGAKSLEEKIFRQVLPAGYRSLSQLINKIEETLNSESEEVSWEEIKSFLLTCQALINIWEKSLEHVIKIGNISSPSVTSLLETSPRVIKSVFQHCKISSVVYGSLFDGASKELTNLFRKANAILKLFLATLEGIIVFDTDVESETELLVNVLDSVGLILAIVNGMDLKTYVETTKIFGKLAIKHQLEIKRASPKIIISHFEQMTKDVCSMLPICKSNIDERTIKATGLLLKILEKLLSFYHPCISDEALIAIIELFSRMNRCTPSCLGSVKTNEKVIDMINRNILMGFEPLLNTVFKCGNFKQAYFEYRQSQDIDAFAYHSLTLAIMKKLITMPYSQHCTWTLGSDSILEAALAGVDNLEEEMLIGELQFLVTHNIDTPQRLDSIYEATLIYICSLISQVPPNGFHAVELMLLKHLLTGQFWSSLLSVDVWCFIGRLGSSELCMNHVKYLLEVNVALSKRRNSLSVLLLEHLIGRLYTYLPEEMKYSLVVEKIDRSPHLWLPPLTPFLPKKAKSFLQKNFAATVNKLSKVFTELREQPTMENWKRLMSVLSGKGMLCLVEEKEELSALLELWKSIANSIENLERRQLDIVSDLLIVLINATFHDNIDDQALIPILEVITSSLWCFPSHVKAVMAQSLQKKANNLENCNGAIANSFAELNCQLLEDTNPLVRQEALDSFNDIVQTCPSDQLAAQMAAAVSKKPSISELIPAYLSGNHYYRLESCENISAYLRKIVRASDPAHVCERYEECERSEKYAKVEVHNTEPELVEQLERSVERLEEISKRQNYLTENTLQKIRFAVDKLEKFLGEKQGSV